MSFTPPLFAFDAPRERRLGCCPRTSRCCPRLSRRSRTCWPLHAVSLLVSPWILGTDCVHRCARLVCEAPRPHTSHPQKSDGAYKIGLLIVASTVSRIFSSNTTVNRQMPHSRARTAAALRLFSDSFSGQLSNRTYPNNLDIRTQKLTIWCKELVLTAQWSQLSGQQSCKEIWYLKAQSNANKGSTSSSVVSNRVL